MTVTGVNRAIRCGVLSLILTVVCSGGGAAQNPPDLVLKVAASAQARSAPISLTPDTELTVRLDRQPASGDGVVRIYVFDQGNVLQAMDDPEVDSDVFRFTPQEAG